MKRNGKTEDSGRPEGFRKRLENMSPRELEQYADQFLDQRLVSGRVRSGMSGPIVATPMGNGMR
jgi:hypothetical protein